MLIHDVLTWIYLSLVLTGATLMVWLMMLISNNLFISGEPKQLKDTRRTALAIAAIGLLWGAKFAFENKWTPWPPDLVLLAGIDLYFVTAIAGAYRYIRLHSASGTPPSQKEPTQPQSRRTWA